MDRPDLGASGEAVKPARRNGIGLTLIATSVLAVALSLLPLPESLRPLPGLRSATASDLSALLLPNRSGTAPAGVAPAAPVSPLQQASAQTEPPEPEAVGGAELALGMLGVADLPGALRTEERARALHTREVAIEQGCRTVGASPCPELALAPYFRALDGLLGGKQKGPVRIVHLGDSLIASDHITDVLRARLQARFGSAGPGFMFVDRPTRSGRGVRAGVASAGWEISRITDRGGAARRTGLSGVTFAAVQPGAAQQVDYATSGARYAELFFLTDPRGGDLRIHADGAPVGKILTRFPKSEPAFARTRIPAGTRTLSVSARGPVQLYGVSLESGAPGIVYDSIGIPGATAELVLGSDPEVFRGQLAHRNPALVVVMLGGNEAFELGRGRGDLASVAASFKALAERIRTAAPKAACLLTSPMDAATRRVDGALVPRAASRELAGVIRDVALGSGCAYWDMLEAMGGLGSVAHWLAAGAMNEDLVHPRAAGADVIGHLADLALTQAYLDWKTPAPLADPPGLERPEALATLFEHLAALEAKGRERVAVLQLGASHTASQLFTDVVRSRLTERFGERGRGFVAAGKASPRLERGGLTRKLEGPWQVLDALTPGARPPWGLTGIRAEGGPGSTAAFELCARCTGTTPSRLQVQLLERPGMGRLELRVDGELLAAYPPETEHPAPARSGLKVLEVETPGERHRLELRNTGPGDVALFGVSQELARPGVVLDAAGLPGSTIFTLSDYDLPVLGEAIRARAPSAVFLFYGTNESALAPLDVRAMRAAYDRTFETLRASAPGASCVLIGPTDRQLQNASGEWVEAPSQRKVVAAVRKIAAEKGCAFWSARAAMGGPGAISRWLERSPPLAHPDHVHLSPDGYAVLARAFAGELLTAYEAWKGKGR